MSIVELLVLAVGVSMDAFAVSVCQGLAVKERPNFYGFLSATYFGGFQALMPLIGYLLGSRFSLFITHVDHWIAFALLAFIGAKMIYESREAGCPIADYRPKAMVLLAFATSIDALVIGITLAFLKVNLFLSLALIGLTTFVICFFGVNIGYRFGSRLKSKSELLGGLILLVIGLKILIEHLMDHGFI